MGLSRVFLLCLSALSALCPAPAQSERRLLRGIVGEALSFNSSVSQNGFLNYGGSNIAMVLGGQITGPKGRFDGRLHWDNETGLFHITELSNQDSGEYIVQDTGGQRRVTVFQLTVYNSVSKPEVTNKTQVSVQCPLLCSVSNGREVTLSWYREGEEKPLKHTSSPDLNTPLTLPLETEGLSHSYSCVATNPVSTERVPVNPGEHCLGKNRTNSKYLVITIALAFLCILIVTCLVLAACLLKRRRNQQKEDPPQEITYTTVTAKPYQTQRAAGSKKQGSSQGNESDHGNTAASGDDIVYASISRGRPHRQSGRSARNKNMENDEYCIYAVVQT